MKVALPLGRLNKEAKKMFCDFFKLSYSFFNEKKKENFTLKKESLRFIF